MVYIASISLFAFALACMLLWLKSVETHRGGRVIMPRVRDQLDHVVETVPQALSHELRLFLARLSLKGHGFTTSVHDGIGGVRTFFRQRTIKLFASIHTGEEVPQSKVSTFWTKFAHRKSNLTRE